MTLPTTDCIVTLGAGRMGRGIALSFALAGVEVLLIDLKDRDPEGSELLFEQSRHELRNDLDFLASVGLIHQSKIDSIMDLFEFATVDKASTRLKNYSIIFEAVPEVMLVKQQAFDYCNEYAAEEALIASTTSTFLVNELSNMVARPQRFLNAHWLNPAHLMPLVEISKGDTSSEENVARMVSVLESVGKVPVICSASAGYIVPRLQALALNEAARLVEEGVASAEDIDKAVKYGFGLRFAVLGLLEFVDWGGGDILYYASNYLSKTIHERYQAPDVVIDNMHNARNGLRDGQGFFDYSDIDVDAYRNRRLSDFVSMLRNSDALPEIDDKFKLSKK